VHPGVVLTSSGSFRQKHLSSTAEEEDGSYKADFEEARTQAVGSESGSTLDAGLSGPSGDSKVSSAGGKSGRSPKGSKRETLNSGSTERQGTSSSLTISPRSDPATGSQQGTIPGVEDPGPNDAVPVEEAEGVVEEGDVSGSANIRPPPLLEAAKSSKKTLIAAAVPETLMEEEELVEDPAEEQGGGVPGQPHAEGDYEEDFADDEQSRKTPIKQAPPAEPSAPAGTKEEPMYEDDGFETGSAAEARAPDGVPVVSRRLSVNSDVTTSLTSGSSGTAKKGATPAQAEVRGWTECDWTPGM
jgi:hypothetical protein